MPAWEGRAADLHRRSARWWAAHDEPLAAIQHAVRADDTDLLVELVHRFAGLLLVTGHHPVLGQVLSRLGESVVAGDPWLTLTATLTRIEAGWDTAPMICRATRSPCPPTVRSRARPRPG